MTSVGWVSFDKAMSYLNASDIFVIPYLSSRHTEKALPHKLFQCMYFGKPLVVSDVHSMMRVVVNECNCGIAFKAGDNKDLAHKVSETMKKNILGMFGFNAKLAVFKKYNWNREANKLLGIYKNLSSTRG